MTTHRITISEENAGMRLDRALADAAGLTRSRLQQLLAQGAVTRGGAAIKNASAKVKAGEYYEIIEPEAEPLDLQPLAMALDILFEDAHLLVINKPVGLTVHPAAGNRTHTLVNALLHHCGDTLSGIGGVQRPGIVHRIDKDTSGLLVVAKTDAAHQALSAQLKSRALKREYITYVWGGPKRDVGTVDAPIARHPTKRKEMAIVEGGRHAVTHYDVLAQFGAKAAKASKQSAIAEHRMQHSERFLVSKLHCSLDTGRTHQIRVHMQHISCPMLGDQTYGITAKSALIKIHAAGITGQDADAILSAMPSRQALHAARLRFIHPISGEPVAFEAPLPEDLLTLENALSHLLPLPL